MHILPRKFVLVYNTTKDLDSAMTKNTDTCHNGCKFARNRSEMEAGLWPNSRAYGRKLQKKR